MLSRTNYVEESDQVSLHRVAGFTFRNSRLKSSLSSVYKNYDVHWDIMNITGLLVLLTIMSATLAMTNNIYVCEKALNTSF